MENGNRSTNSAGAFLLGSLIGGAAGYLSALILAPHSGEETQAEIKARAMALKQRADEAVLQGRRTLEEGLSKGQNTVADWLSQGSTILDQRAKELSN